MGRFRLGRGRGRVRGGSDGVKVREGLRVSEGVEAELRGRV